MAGKHQLNVGPVGVEVERRADGSMRLRSPHPLGAYPDKLGDRLIHWAGEAPDRTLFARRGPDGAWNRLGYADVLSTVRRLGQALLDRGLSPDRPLLILSGNDLDHALLALAAMHVGVPYTPLSPAYSLVSTDHGKLRHVVNLLTPGLIFAADGAAFGRAIAALPPDVELVVSANLPVGRQATLLADMAATPATAAVDRAHDAVGPDTVAKILFTSGSTGLPKGVINTQRMLCSNQQMLRDVFCFLGDEPPVIVDWLPWNHTFGSNHNFGMMIYNGGTLYIDDGKPMPGAIAATVANLREIAPTAYFNVPKGYEALLPYLQAEPDLCRLFFSRLRMMYYAGAGMAPHVWDALTELAREHAPYDVLIATGLGATETAPFALSASWPVSRPGLVGLPVQGVELKLAPVGHKLEARVRGPSITPGYWRQDDLTAKAFDEEGFYRFGDALRFVDETDVMQGFEFDGRIAEDFKLSTGTWVSVLTLRTRLIGEAAPLVRDVVIAGHDQDFVTALIFPDLEACRARCPDVPPAGLLKAPVIRRHFQQALDVLAARATGSANRIARAVLLEELPSIDAGEVTDKGSINQRAVLDHRKAIVQALYAAVPPSDVLVAASEKSSHVA
ncbi:MAG: feruloyl-CoA synthase [Alphaproteobacteria bacterium]|nr:feruloyl-CoA synthase [Alphaproteobacteria bacterium]